MECGYIYFLVGLGVLLGFYVHRNGLKEDNREPFGFGMFLALALVVTFWPIFLGEFLFRNIGEDKISPVKKKLRLSKIN